YLVDEKGKLKLNHLDIGLDKAEETKPLFGKTARHEADILKSMNGYVFEDLDAPVPFSGGMLLGSDFLREYYVHMGFHPAWKYADVVELIFDAGQLVQEFDRSTAMAEVRAKFDPKQLRGPSDPASIEAWVARCFSRDYER